MRLHNQTQLQEKLTMSSNSTMYTLHEAFLHRKRNPSHVNQEHIKSVCVCVCVCVWYLYMYVCTEMTDIES